MRGLCAVAMLLVLVGCASGLMPWQACANPGRPAKGQSRSSVSVALPDKPRGPAFYLISNHYLIMMRREDVITAVQSFSPDDTVGPNARFLAAVQARPLTEPYTDLKTFTFEDWRLWDRPDFIAAALLEAGSASVVDLWGDNGSSVSPPQVKSISVVTRFGGGTWREFCVPNGDAVLSVTDMIAN